MAKATPIALLLLGLSAAPALADDNADIRAARKFAEPVLNGECDFRRNDDGSPDGDNAVYPITYRDKGQDQDSPDNKRMLVRLACSSGAYNFNSIYVMRDDAAGTWQVLSFAEPVADYDYTDESFSRLKAPPKVIGYTTTVWMTNSDYDPATKTISAAVKWRGIGDAWSAGEWQFDQGAFLLRRYEIDPTYQSGDETETSDPESYILFDANVAKP